MPNTFPESSCHEPGVFAITRTGKIVGFPVANAGVSLRPTAMSH